MTHRQCSGYSVPRVPVFSDRFTAVSPSISLFNSFFLGGFECSTHRLASGRRLDMIAATGHDRHAAADYARLREHGIRTARDGVRWHLVESTPGRFDFSSVLPTLRAAREAGVQVLWDF